MMKGKPSSQPAYSTLDVEAEGSPLLVNPRSRQGWAGARSGPQVFKDTPRGQWRFSCIQCWGDCSPSDLNACAVSQSCPIFAWAWNQNRALALPFGVETLRIFLLSMVLSFLSVPYWLLSHLPKNEEGERPYPLLQALLSVALLCVWLYVVYFLALRRAAIRERFGISGSFLEDYCIWCWCKCCALSQETRTLWHEQVHEGVCYGPLPGVHPPAYPALDAPQPQQFVV